MELVHTTSDVLAHLKVSVARVDADEAGRETMVRWDYVLTSLTPNGAEGLTQDVLSKKLDGLVVAMDHYLRHGEMVQFPAGD